MDTLSPIKSLAIAALVIVPMSLMGCSNSLTGVNAPGDQDVIHADQPAMGTTSGDSAENLPPPGDS